MSSDTEVFIPDQACVITVPVHSFPSSITRKMCIVHSDRPATFISPVELRGKGGTCTPRPLTSGEFLLPVVTSNRKALGILRKFLCSGENSLRFSEENPLPGPAFSNRKNSIILFNTQVFLIVRKAKTSDSLLEQRSSSPSGHEAPPLDSPPCGGSDITEGRSQEAPCGAEDDGKEAEKRRGDGTQDDDITERGRSKDGTGAAEDHGKCAIKGREADVMKDGEEKESLTPMQDMSTNTASVGERNRTIKLEEKSGVSLLASAQDRTAAENQITADFTQSLTNPELAREQRRADETGLATESQTGNEKYSSDNLKHGAAETIISDGECSSAKAKCCKQLIFPTNQSPSLININKLRHKSDANEQTSGLEMNSDQIKVSVGAAEDFSDHHQVSGIIAEDVNILNDGANSTSSVSIQAGEGQRSRRESTVEIIDVDDDDDDDENTGKANASGDENLLGKSESGKKRTNDRFSPPGATQHKSHDIAMETSTESDDLIIVESWAGVEGVKARRDAEVVEVVGSSADQPSRHASKDKRHANKTSAKAKGEVWKGESSSVDDKNYERSIEIIDSDDDCILHQSTNNANRDTTSLKSGDGASPSLIPSLIPSLKRCEGAVEFVDLNEDDDDVIINNRNVNGRQIGDLAKGCKRRITDETDSDVAAADQISDVSTSSAKRSKRDDDNDVKRDVDPDCRVKNFNRDVEVIEVDDDEDDDESRRSANKANKTCANEAATLRNPGDTEGSADEVSSRNRDDKILDSSGHCRDAAESQSSVEKMKSCKRRASRSDDTEDVESHAQMNEAEDSLAKRFKSNANVSKPDGKGHGERANNQISVRANDQRDLINNKNSFKAHVSAAECLLITSDVEITAVHDKDQLSRESSQEPNQDVTNSEKDVNKTINQNLSAAGPSSSHQNKSLGATCEIADVFDDVCDVTKQSGRNVESFVEPHVSEVENKSATESVETRDGQKRAASNEQNRKVTNDKICVSETPCAANAAIRCDDEVNRDKTPSEVSAQESNVGDANAGRNSGLASASFTQIGDGAGPSACCESDAERQADGDGEFANKQSEATHQSGHGEEAVGLLRPSSPRANQEFDYKRLQRDENISRLRARLHQIKNKLITISATNKDAQEC